MKTNFLTHVVPTLSPHSGGIGEYALELACQLKSRCGIDGQFVLCDPEWSGPARIKGFRIRRLRFPNEAHLWGLLSSMKEEPSVLVHYDGHAYQKNGLPTWLFRGLRSWLADPSGPSARGSKRLFTVFHELWGPTAQLWRGEFCLQMLQRRLVGKLHRLSQVSITSGQHRQVILDQIVSQKTLLLPIPSSLPIAEKYVPRAKPDAPLQIAIMAQPGSRFDATKGHANLLRTLDRTNRIAGAVFLRGHDSTIESFNQEYAFLKECVAPHRISIHSQKMPGDVSQLLGGTDLLLAPYGGDVACKSGSLMAALAAGCATVLRDGRNAAPLKEGVHFIASDDSPFSVVRFERLASQGELGQIANAGRSWYQQFADWKVVAQKYQEALQTRAPLEAAQGLSMKLPLLSLPAVTR